jgi:hypothetical protein
VADKGWKCWGLGFLLIAAVFVACGKRGHDPRKGPPLGQCTYTNPFSHAAECKNYTGSRWTQATAAVDCRHVYPGVAGTYEADAGCDYPYVLGTCEVGDDSTGFDYVDPGTNGSDCGSTRTGCEVFAGGLFVAGDTCGGPAADAGPPLRAYGTDPFVQPYQVCTDPLPGELPGRSDGGQVCTWTLISGCTEDGRHFQDYASCSDVRTQRPYYPVAAAGTTAPNDPRLQDSTYMGEVAWVKTQVQAAACVCCHSSLAPDGPGQWSIDAPGIWLDSVPDDGIAMMAGLADSSALGAYPSSENNGFDRRTTGLPTTDIARMQHFMVSEWIRRGHTPEEGAQVPPFGGPIVDQENYVPTGCMDGEGVAADGTVTWTGGPARYVYVLDQGSRNPGVPPNLDEPAGTFWLVDVPWTEGPMSSGIRYGAVASPQVQRIPASGKPDPLIPGATYYLYVLKDIGFPLTRCLFTAP